MKWYQWLMAFTWELPQTLVALIMWPILRCRKSNEPFRSRMVLVHTSTFLTWWSLGEFIFATTDPYECDTFKHEYGHSRQSRILGVLYLIIIALPSVIYCGLCKIFPKLNEYYYSMPWEAWADKLGGVERR